MKCLPTLSTYYDPGILLITLMHYLISHGNTLDWGIILLLYPILQMNKLRLKVKYLDWGIFIYSYWNAVHSV